MKRLLSTLVSLSVASVFIAGASDVSAEDVYTVTQNGYTMSCTVDENGEAHIISCRGSGSADILIPSVIESSYTVAYIESGAFSGLTEISAVEIPDSVRVIGSRAFQDCSSLNNVYIGSGAAEIGDYAFMGCFSLDEAVIPDSVTKLGKGSFMNCSAMKYAELGTGIVSVPEDCFSMCVNLASVEIPENAVSFGERAFFCCNELSGIYLHDNITNIEADAFGTHYDIISGENAPIYGFFILGSKDSAAHRYAAASGVDFIDLAEPPLGDVDKDGIIGPADATCVLVEYAQVSLNMPSSFTMYQRLAGDYNRDGTINVVDATGILIYYTENSIH